MKYNKTISILLLSQALFANADKVTFKVMAVKGTPVLNINGQQHQMTLDTYPVYKTEVDVNLPVSYKYSIDNEVEEFERKRESKDESYNEFFGRSITIKEHPLLPRAYPAFKTAKYSKLYDDNFVSTIIVKTTQLQELYNNIENTEFTVPAEVIYATPYTVKTFKNAELAIGGQSTRNVPKLSFKLKGLKDGNKELYGRSTIKLRAEHMDPSFIRDKLYGDVLAALGVPAVQNKFARLFINDEAIGFYDISDSVSSDKYLKSMYNNDEKYKSANPLFKADFCPSCGGIGDLGYYGDDISNPMYQIYTYKGDDKTTDGNTHFQQELLPLLKDIDNYKKGLTKDEPFDSDTFLKYMAMEFLAGGIDNYWNKPGNFYVFKDLEKNKWYFHDSDFHFSFGAGGDPNSMMNTPLAQYPPELEENVGKERPPLDAFRSNPDLEKKFLSIFERLIKTALHPNAVNDRINSIAELIKEDAYWDFTLPKTNPNPTLDQELVYTSEMFDITLGESDEGPYNTVPIKTFLKNRLNNIAQELNIQIPANYEDNLGYVENVSSGAFGRYTWSIYSAIIILIITLLL